MAFLHPALLWGTALVSVPIIIYLLQRHKVKEIEWAAMQFLLDILEEQQRRITLEELLLLLLRCLMILFLALAVSRPLLRGQMGGMLGGGDAALLVDASYSMGTRRGAESRWQRARDAALELLDEQPSSFGVSLLLASSQPETMVGGFSPDHALLAETIKGLQTTDLTGGPRASLAKAEALFKASQQAVKRLYLISDFQQRDWAAPEKETVESLKRLQKGGCLVTFVPIFDDQNENLSISELSLPAGAARVGARTLFAGRIHNHGAEEARDVAVDLLVDGEVAESATVNVMPGQSAHLLFPFTPTEAGSHRAQLRVRDDLLPGDNNRYLGFQATDAIPILGVVENLTGPDELKPTDLLELAIDPYPERSESLEALYQVRHISGADLPAEMLTEYSVVCLAGLSGLTSGEVAQLEDYVRKGGGVLLFLDAKANVSVYNANLYRDGKGLLPWSLLPDPLESPDKDSPLRFLVKHSEHPVWQPLFRDQTDHFALVRFYRGFGFKRGDSKRVLVLAEAGGSEDDLHPIMLDIQHGRGHVLAIGTSMAPTLNNWAAHTSFVTFLNQAVRYLRSFKTGRTEVMVGQPLVRYVGFQQSQSTYSLVYPGGDTRAISVLQEGEDYRLDLPALLQAGTYRLENQQDPNDRMFLAANVDPREGDIRAMSAEELRTLYEPHGVLVRGTKGDEGDAGGGMEFAGILLILMLLCWLGENLLAYRMSKR